MVLEIILFLLGLCVGSFLNAFLYRYETKQTLSGRSFCPKCKHKIAWYDNMPVFSYVILRGKCRHCKKPISAQYPVVEALTGISFLLIGLYTAPAKYLSIALLQMTNDKLQITNKLLITNSLMLICLLLVACCLILITVYDLRTKEIPNGFNLAFIVASILYSIVASIGASNFLVTGIWYLISGTVAFLFFYFFVAVSHETWMGGGDAKFALGMGIFLGPWNTLLAIIIASWSGAIFGIAKIIIQNTKHKKISFRFSHLSSRPKRKDLSTLLEMTTKKEVLHSGRTINRQSKIDNRKSHEIPFGPFLVLGTIISFLFGSQIIAWYARIFLGL